MIDKRTLEFILADQQEEMEERAEETLCRRPCRIAFGIR